MNYIFHGGIADGARGRIEALERWNDATPSMLWVETDPQQRGPFSLMANIKGEGTPYQLVGIDADNDAHYHADVNPTVFLNDVDESIERFVNNGGQFD